MVVALRCSCTSSHSAQDGRGPDCPSSLEIGRKNEPVLKSARFHTGVPPDFFRRAASAGDCSTIATASRNSTMAWSFLEPAA